MRYNQVMKFNSKEHMKKIKQIEWKVDKKRQEFDGFTNREKAEMVFLCLFALIALAGIIAFIIASIKVAVGV